jgi:hypothetical protein
MHCSSMIDVRKCCESVCPVHAHRAWIATTVKYGSVDTGVRQDLEPVAAGGRFQSFD